MIPTFIVLLVIAIALGGYIIFDILHEKKKTEAINNHNEKVVANASPQSNEEPVVEKSTETVAVDVLPITDEEAEPTNLKTDTMETNENSSEEVAVTLIKK